MDDVGSNGLIVDNVAPRTGSGEGTRWSHTFTAADNSVEVEIGQIEGGLAGEDARYAVSGFILSRAGAPLEFTDITVVGNQVTLTWSSRPGKVYAVEWSNDLIEWDELDDGVDSGGDSTSFVDDAVV